MDSYLAESEVCDFNEAGLAAQARQLAEGMGNHHAIAQRCFEFVRDAIRHSFDDPYDGGAAVTCSASEVLAHGHGICYAKSHLLTALLRANGIPAGFDYQRLDDDEGGYCLHGFTTVHLPGVGWYRVDARGNKPGVSAHFTPPEERLTWPATGPGECDYRLNLAEPLPEVVAALRRAGTVETLSCSLPTGVRMG